MTKEELKQKAENYANNKADKGNYDYAVGDNVYFCKSALEQAYIAGAGQREKRIAELEAQIEQLVYLHNEDVNTIKLLNKQIKEIKENG